MPGFHVLPVYGGSDYTGQLRQLKRGVHVVVGTPGRVMDHMRRGSLNLSELKTLVLDEADEMLRMGFIDDVQWILEQTPQERQIALFSATMPDAIRRIAKRHLRDPKEVAIKVKAVTTDLIRQRVWMMAGMQKLDALTRILEVEDFDGMLIFVRTRILTSELSDKLSARGYSVAALNGDIPQKLREQTVEKLKNGKLDIVVATDVAARGLDVQRISHVINYDIPSDVEAYVHRIGRTGRAGRKGDAILFAASRERRLLGAIEKATGGTLEKMELPTAEEVTDKRVGKFKQRITETLATADLEIFRKLVQDYQHEYGVPVLEIAAALGMLAQGKKPLEDKAPTKPKFEKKSGSGEARSTSGKPRRERPNDRDRNKDRERKPSDNKRSTGAESKPARKTQAEKEKLDIGMERFRIAVGKTHGVKPGNIVGAIANEAEIDSEYIGRVEIFDDHSTVDLPEGMPKQLLKHLKTVWVSGQRLQITKVKQSDKPAGGAVGKQKPTKPKREESHPEDAPAKAKKSKDTPSSKPSVRRRPAK
jgi:ATP-dependent RNA helicase DeaD